MYRSKFTGEQIDSYLDKIANNEVGGSSPIIDGDGENSAVLKGGNNIAMEILSTTNGLNNASVGPYSNSEGYASKSILEYYNIDDIKYSNENEDAIRDALYQKHTELKEEDPTGNNLFSVAWNLGSHVEGRNGLAVGERAHAEGVDNVAYGHNSHAEGQQNIAKGNNSHVEGSTNIVDGRNAHAEGSHNKSIGEASHTEGIYLQSTGKASHSEGLGVETYEYGAFGNYSHHEGGYNKVNGAYSHGEGANNETSGTAAHVEGRYNIAKGNFTHAEGRNTQTSNEAEHASGKYNLSTQSTDKSKATHFSIGIGTSDINRKNAFEVKQNGDIYIEGVEGKIQDKLNQSIGSSSPMVSVTYEELVALRDNGELVAGMQYRITDHVTTTAQENTRSAEHQFDVIVTADNENTLNEVARACLHDGDTYFSQAGANLAAWQIWYCLDNDKTRFLWADEENGRGVIYRMIDEFGNDCPYDFKNILFIRDGKEYFTFSVTQDNQYFNDYSVDSKRCAFNVIHPWLITESYINKRKLNNNVFITDASGTYYDIPCMGNVLEENCYDNTFGTNTVWNHIGPFSDNNKFGNEVKHNTTLSRFSYNTLGNEIHHSTFGTQCKNNVIGNYIFQCHMGDGCISNLLASYSKCIEFGNGVYGVKLSAPGASESNYLRNYHVANGLNEGGNSTISPSISRGEDFNYIIAKNSSGVVKVFCIADLADIV